MELERAEVGTVHFEAPATAAWPWQGDAVGRRCCSQCCHMISYCECVACSPRRRSARRCWGATPPWLCCSALAAAPPATHAKNEGVRVRQRHMSRRNVYPACCLLPQHAVSALAPCTAGCARCEASTVPRPSTRLGEGQLAAAWGALPHHARLPAKRHRSPPAPLPLSHPQD